MSDQSITSPASYPVALSIAGSDNSGGAGLQADLKTFTTLGVYGTTAVTCVVAEHPGQVLSIEPVPPLRVREQIRLVNEAFPIAAMKTGMLYSREIIEAVAEALPQGIPLVIDPVMVASSGTPLLRPEAIEAMGDLLLSRATVVTPNRDEAALLWGRPINTFEELRLAARELSERFQVPFLVKGGHLQQVEALDVLYFQGECLDFSEPMVPGVNPHGTGCTFSAAITAGLAKGLSLTEAVRLGKDFITRAIRRHLRIGGYDLLNHFIP
jgi:hydroxymethylpyrimidine/phosphomethylpyrimidine kinase